MAAKKKAKSKPKSKAPAKAPAKPQKTRVAPVVTAPPESESEINAKVYRRFYEEVLNGGNLDVAAELLDPVVLSHSPLPGQEPGAAGFIAALTTLRAAFPDLHVIATHLVAEGDHVAARFQVAATHRGDFFGIRATGRRIHYEEMAFVRFARGRIVEHWAVADALAIMQQLGAWENR